MENFVDTFKRELIKTNTIPKSNGRIDTLNFLCKNNKYKTCLEFGVYKGCSLEIISNHCDRAIGFDSFEGLPESWDIGSTIIKKGTFVQTTLPTFNEKITSLEIGLFQDTLIPFLEKNPNLIFDMIHFDMDIYSAAYFVFETLITYDKLKNVTIIFDELINYPNFENGEMKALYEMVQKYQLEYEIIGTHGNMLNLTEMKELKNMPFKELRKSKYFQECAIKIVGYEQSNLV